MTEVVCLAGLASECETVYTFFLAIRSGVKIPRQDEQRVHQTDSELLNMQEENRLLKTEQILNNSNIRPLAKDRMRELLKKPVYALQKHRAGSNRIHALQISFPS